MSLKKALISTLSFLLTFNTSAIFSNQVYSINPGLRIKGPVYDSIGRREYNSRVFRIILEEAHELAKEYKDYEDYFAYWTFLTGALTVPKHEGSNLHFKKVTDQSKCLNRSNTGSILPNGATTTKTIFNRVFKVGPIISFPECSEFRGYDFFYQILHGHDGTDIGMMQVNIRWHEKDYLALGNWRNVRESVRYGLKLYKRGFETLYRSPSRYSCITYSDGSINPYNLIRGAWAGVYNSGNASKSCRFEDKSSAWRRNDEGFKKSLDKIVGLNLKANRNVDYPLKDAEDAVIGAIIENFKSDRSNTAFVTYFINNPNVTVSDLAANDPALTNVDRPEENNGETPVHAVPVAPVVKPIEYLHQIAETHTVTAQNLFIRTAPNRSGKKCGLMPRGFEVETLGKTKNGWYQLKADSKLKERYSRSRGYSYNECINDDAVFASGSYLALKVPTVDDIVNHAVISNSENEENTDNAQTEEPVVAETDDAFEDENSTSDAIIVKKAIILSPGAVVRQGMPSGYTMAPKTGDVLFPNEEVQYVEKLFNSSRSKHAWYQIIHPYQGWVYGSLVKEIE